MLAQLGCFSRALSKVVLPLPKKPVNKVTGVTLDAAIYADVFAVRLAVSLVQVAQTPRIIKSISRDLKPRGN